MATRSVKKAAGKKAAPRARSAGAAAAAVEDIVEVFAPSPHDLPQDQRGTSSALGRAIEMLETVLETDGALGIQEICTRLNLPRQSAHRILNQLLELKLLQRHVGKEQYTIGPRLKYLTLMTAHQSHKTGPWHSVLTEFAKCTEETVNLGIFDQNKVLLIDRIEAEYALRVHSEIGRRLDPHSSSIGKLLLAHLPRTRRLMLLKQAAPLKRYTSFTMTDVDELENEFVEIRRNGWALSNQGTMLGMFSLAAPVRDSRGRVLAALGVQAPLVRVSLEQAVEEFVPDMVRCADKMSEFLVEEEVSFRGEPLDTFAE